MTLRCRPARREDVAAVVALLHDDLLGEGREHLADLTPYLAAFDAMAAETGNQLIVGEVSGRIVATYQLIFISGLSHAGTRRAEIEAVRVAANLRGQGLGADLIRDAEARARAAGCGVMQLTTNKARTRAHAFYCRLGYTPSHEGFKKALA
ncbi:GNAT family N-acetyltransferase [Fluviibacterium sp. DFM31]|uniref:GNAT family N-acetyltransferase n=1 Tax=Meridianimarinicoccus marinus TaxID=3231483 RepID=A0ABV3L2I3_9RHOB